MALATPVNKQPRQERQIASPYVKPTQMANAGTPAKIKTSFDPNNVTTQDLSMKVPQVTPAPTPMKTSGDFLAEMQSYFTPNVELEGEVQRGQQNQSESLRAVIEQMGRLASRGARTSEMEDQYGIPELTTDLTDITNKYRAKQVSFMRQRERMETAAGLTAGQKDVELRNLDRIQAREMADLAIIKEAASNNLLSAQAIVDRKIQLEFADEETRLDALKFFYTENKEIFTKKEQRLYEENLAREQAKFGFAKDQYQMEQTQKFQAVAAAAQAGASTAELEAIQGAPTAMDAARIANTAVARRSNAEFSLNQANVYSQIADRNARLDLARQEANSISSGNLGEVDVSKMNATERKAFGFAQRIGNTLGTFDKLAPEITKLSTLSFMAQRKMPSWLQSGTVRQQEQAERDFINAVLRQESGAAIAESEFDNARRQYFPQPGDDAATLEQKRINREGQFENFLNQAGIQGASFDLPDNDDGDDPLGIL